MTEMTKTDKANLAAHAAEPDQVRARAAAAAAKAKEDEANRAAKVKNPDAGDPANQAGSTGNAATMTSGIRKMPTEQEDKDAKAQAEAAGKGFEGEMDAGNSRAATRIETTAIRDGASVLGKEAVVVQDSAGNPVVGRRGLQDNPASKASATNPALAANDAIPMAPPVAPEGMSKEDAAKAEEAGKRVVPMHA